MINVVACNQLHIFVHYRSGSTFNANLRDSPDTANLPIGNGPLDGDTSDPFQGYNTKEFGETDRCRYNPWLNRILEHPTS